MGCCDKARAVAKAVARVPRGAVGLTKAGLRIRRATQAETERRRTICRTSGPGGGPCEYAVRNPRHPTWDNGRPRLHRCTRCGCYLAPKTSDMDQRCPIGKWIESDPTIR